MSEPIELAPCPFCGGPPCVTLELDHGVTVEAIPEDGATGSAHVWCHECGAQGPRSGEGLLCSVIFDAADVEACEREACRLWNQRDARHLPLYIAGHADGLQKYPRDPERAQLRAPRQGEAPGARAIIDGPGGERHALY